MLYKSPTKRYLKNILSNNLLGAGDKNDSKQDQFLANMHHRLY